MTSTELLTQQEHEQWAAQVDEVQAILSQIKAALADGREALWRLTEALYAFHEARGWLKLGYETLEEWLADPEIGMKKASYWERVATWRRLVVERRVNPDRVRSLELSKVALVTEGIVRGKSTIDNALSDAEALGKRDLREKYKRSTGRPPGDDPRSVNRPPDDGDPATLTPEVVAGEVVDAPGWAGDDADEPSPPAATSPPAQALVDAEVPLPWEEIEAGYDSGGAYPQMSREAFGALLLWRARHEGGVAPGIVAEIRRELEAGDRELQRLAGKGLT